MRSITTGAGIHDRNRHYSCIFVLRFIYRSKIFIIHPLCQWYLTDIVNQNLKDSTGRIKNICGITTSVNQERFKINLAEFITQDTEIYKELEKVIFDRV